MEELPGNYDPYVRDQAEEDRLDRVWDIEDEEGWTDSE